MTLLEVLVTAAILAVLAGIVLLTIGDLRKAATGVDDLQRLRAIHTQFREWSLSHNDYFVNRGPPPGSESLVLSLQGESGTVTGPYFMQMWYWTWVLAADNGRGERWWHPRREDEEPLGEAVVPPMPGAQFVRRSDFTYSSAMLADPAYWTYPSCNYESGVKKAFFRKVRWSETAHPSAKGLHFDADALERSRSLGAPVVFVDGSAEDTAWSAAVRAGIDDCPVGVPLVATHEGVRGRDFNR